MQLNGQNAADNTGGHVYSTVAVDIPAPWRLLTRTDTMQRGDQGLNDDCETWHDVAPLMYGMPYNPAFFVPVRRAMLGCKTPDSCRGRDGCNGTCKLTNLKLCGSR